MDTDSRARANNFTVEAMIGLGITCVLYHICVQGIPILSPLLLCHPHIPHSFEEVLHLLLSSTDLITIPNLKSADHIGAGKQCYEQQKKTTS